MFLEARAATKRISLHHKQGRGSHGIVENVELAWGSPFRYELSTILMALC